MSNAMKWVRLDPADANPVSVGDLVSSDAGGMPIFKVERVEGGKLWLGDGRRPANLVRPLDAFRWKASLA